MPSYLSYKRVLDGDDDIVWFTTKKGVHIPILPGQTKEDALNSFSKDPKKHLSHPAVQKTHGREAILEQIRKENENLLKNSTTPEKYKEDYLNKLVAQHGYISPKGNFTKSQFWDLEEMRKDIEQNAPYESLQAKRTDQWRRQMAKEKRAKAKNMSIAENSFVGKKQGVQSLVDGNGDWVPEPFMKEIRKVLMANGWKPYHSSGNRVASSSSYYEKNGETLRLSDHGLPTTPEREYKTQTGQRKGWTHEYILNDRFIEQLARIQSEKEFKDFVLEDLED